MMINGSFRFILVLLASGLLVGVGYYLGSSTRHQANSSISNFDSNNSTQIPNNEINVEQDSNPSQSINEDPDETSSDFEENSQAPLTVVALVNELEAGRIYLADLETERLIMNILGKNSISAEDFTSDKLSCDRLKEIDDLWTEYTGENFGFSAIRNAFIYSYLEYLYGAYATEAYHLGGAKRLTEQDKKWRISDEEEALSGAYDKLLFDHVLAAISSTAEFEATQKPTYISAILPKETEPSIERFFAINSMLERCQLVNRRDSVIRKEIVDRYSPNFLDEASLYMQNVNKCNNPKSFHDEIRCDALPPEPPKPHPWYLEFYNIPF